MGLVCFEVGPAAECQNETVGKAPVPVVCLDVSTPLEIVNVFDLLGHSAERIFGLLDRLSRSPSLKREADDMATDGCLWRSPAHLITVASEHSETFTQLSQVQR